MLSDWPRSSLTAGNQWLGRLASYSWNQRCGVPFYSNGLFLYFAYVCSCKVIAPLDSEIEMKIIEPCLRRFSNSDNKFFPQWCDDEGYLHSNLILTIRKIYTQFADADEEVSFDKAFDVTGKPDGSHKVVLVGVVSTSEELPSYAQLLTHLVLPSLESPNQFALESHECSSAEQAQNGSKVESISSCMESF